MGHMTMQHLQMVAVKLDREIMPINITTNFGKKPDKSAS